MNCVGMNNILLHSTVYIGFTIWPFFCIVSRDSVRRYFPSSLSISRYTLYYTIQYRWTMNKYNDDSWSACPIVFQGKLFEFKIVGKLNRFGNEKRSSIHFVIKSHHFTLLSDNLTNAVTYGLARRWISFLQLWSI